MKVYSGITFAEVYSASLLDLFANSEYETKPRDLKIKENLNVSLIVKDPSFCLYKNPFRSSQYKYIAAEFLWYFLGRNDVKFIKKYASFWDSIKNDNGTVNSAYGNLIFKRKNKYDLTQYEWAYQSLINDKDTRQAILHFNTPEHQYFSNKDFVCTIYAVFHIRNNKLNFTVHMRSNDVILGTPTDFAFFATLQCQMLAHLKPTYLELELGTLTHCVDSYHLYERHFGLVDNMIDHPFTAEQMPTVSKNLINIDGSSTDSIQGLFECKDDGHLYDNDKLYKWIFKNLKS